MVTLKNVFGTKRVIYHVSFICIVTVSDINTLLYFLVTI